VSLATAPPSLEKTEQYTWNKKIFTAETEELKALPWYKNYRILAILLLIVTAIIVGWFW
jgi:SSS family solute:Na+ symporter